MATNAQVSAIEAITKRAAELWTKRRLMDSMVLGSRIAPFAGSAEEVADYLAGYIEASDADGFNLPRAVTPECLTDSVDLVVPILQERGVHKAVYAEGPLRQKLFGHPRLTRPHVGARSRALELV